MERSKRAKEENEEERCLAIMTPGAITNNDLVGEEVDEELKFSVNGE